MRFHRIAGCFAAFVFAALAAALVGSIPYGLFAGSSRFAGFLLLAFAICLGHAFVFGLPLFLLFRRKGWVNVFSCVGGGFVLGSAGVLLLTIAQSGLDYSYIIGNTPHVVNGVPTAAGLLGVFTMAAFLGLHGAIAGLVFWGIARWTGVALPAAAASQVGSSGKRWLSTGLAVAAVMASGAIFAWPVVAYDKTCHNKFREVRTVKGPVTRIDLLIVTEDWPKLVPLFREFGESEQLSFRNSGRNEFGQRRGLALSLCNEAGVNIEASGTELWAQGVGISVFQLRDGAGAVKFGSDLAAKLEQRWPGSVRFRDVRGQIISGSR
jgi:hypothetical protein